MSLYKQKGSAIWWANISLPGRPRLRVSTGCVDREAAGKEHDRLKAEHWNYKPAAVGPTWGEAVAVWCAKQQRSKSDLINLRAFCRRYPDRALSECTEQSFVQALAFCKTDGTYTRYRAVVKAILNGVKHQVDIPSRKKRKAKPRDWITLPQWRKLYAELPEHQKIIAAFSIETGLRQANALNLRWEQLDMKRKIAWFEGYEMKNGHPLGVPLSDGALSALRQAMKTQAAPERVADALLNEQPKGYVFTYRGQPIKNTKAGFRAACVRAGLGTFLSGSRDGPYEGFTWHGLRHTWATWHVQNGTPIEVLKDLGGWSDLRMVMNYAHHSAGHLAAFANANKTP